MLQLRTTRIFKSSFEDLASGVAIQEEGVALAYVKENGVTKVQPSTGAPGEVFAGFALARNMPPSAMPMVEEGIAEDNGALTRAPIAGQVRVLLDDAEVTVVTDPTHTPAADEIVIVGASYKVAAGNVGKAITAQYMYAPTVAEARTILGDAPYGGLAANALGTVGTIKQAEVGTSFFDASADWSDAIHAKLADGGKLAPSTGPSDRAIPGMVVKSAPVAGSPFLVVEINVG